MHVAAVGSRAVSASASDPRLPPVMPARCTQNGGVSWPKPRSGVLGHAVTNRSKSRCSSSVNSFTACHSATTVGWSGAYPPLYVADRAKSPTSILPPAPAIRSLSSAGANTLSHRGATSARKPRTNASDC